MKTRIFALAVALCLLVAACAVAEGTTPGLTTEYRWFVNSYRNVRGRTVTYYDNVYAFNHGTYGLTPFADAVPAEYFVLDEMGYYAVAPIVLDVADAMRQRLYGADVGEVAMLYGQYCERVTGKKNRVGFSGIHEGLDFVQTKGAPLYAILGGEVTRAGDSNGTVGIYSAEYDATLLYLHCEKINVKRGDVVEPGAQIAVEGKKGSGGYYTHVEFRKGRHTSSNKYRDIVVQSDCPYAVMREALGVTESGRAPLTFAEADAARRAREAAEEAARAEAARLAAELERQKQEAEAAAKAEADRLAAEAQAQAEATPDVPLVDILPGVTAGYGFATPTPAPETPAAPEATPTPVPEATLPPAGN